MPRPLRQAAVDFSTPGTMSVLLSRLQGSQLRSGILRGPRCKSGEATSGPDDRRRQEEEEEEMDDENEGGRHLKCGSVSNQPVGSKNVEWFLLKVERGVE